jgi:hypothetical protein
VLVGVSTRVCFFSRQKVNLVQKFRNRGLIAPRSPGGGGTGHEAGRMSAPIRRATPSHSAGNGRTGCERVHELPVKTERNVMFQLTN